MKRTLVLLGWWVVGGGWWAAGIGHAAPSAVSARTQAPPPARRGSDPNEETSRGLTPFSPAAGELQRGIYVPYPDLEAVFGPGQKGMMLTRAEYERLSAEAQAASERLKLAGRPPFRIAVLDAAYTGQVTETQAAVEARLTLEDLGGSPALEESVVALPLGVRGAAIESAQLDGQPALIGADATGQLTLFVPVSATGAAPPMADAAALTRRPAPPPAQRRQLILKLLVRVEPRTHDSLLRLGLPSVPASAMTLTFDSDIEVSVSVPVLERTYDKTTNKTTVRLAPGLPSAISSLRSGISNLKSQISNPESEIVLTFVPNDVRRERAPLLLSDLTARVYLTEGHARLDATFVYTVLRKDLDQFTITLPTDLAVTEVAEPNLLSWAVEKAGGAQKVLIRLHEPKPSATVRLVADAELKSLGAWTFPHLATEGAAVERGVLLLALADLHARGETLSNVRRADEVALAALRLLPGAVRETGPGLPTSMPAEAVVQAAATTAGGLRAYAFWRQPYRCAVDLFREPTEVVSFNNLVLRLSDEELQLTSQVTLIPRVGRVYAARLRLPRDWSIIAVSTSRPPDRYAWQEIPVLGSDPIFRPEGRKNGVTPLDVSGKDVLITLKDRLAEKEALVVTVDARVVPDGWTDRAWRNRTVPIPEVLLMDVPEGKVSETRGQFGVWSDPEFSVAPAALTNLEAVDVRELRELTGGSGRSLALGFRFDRQPARGALAVTRLDPRIQVETVGYASLGDDVLRSNIQLNYTVERAGRDTFRFVIEDQVQRPGAATPIHVRGVKPADTVAGVVVKDWDRIKDYAGPGDAWVVHTQTRVRGPVSLLVSFETELGGALQPKSGATPKTPLPVPTIRCLDVERQSGYVLVEGRDDTELVLQPGGGRPGMAPLTEVDLVEVPRILGYRPSRTVVTAYRYLALPIALSLVPERHAEAPIPRALVKSASLTTVVERSGACRTEAVFQVLLAQPAPVQVALPAGAELWSALVHGQPVKPQVVAGLLTLPVERVSPAGVEVSLLYAHSVGRRGHSSFPAEGGPKGAPQKRGVSPFSGLGGTLALQPPQIVGLEVAQAAWDVYLPEDLRCLAPRGAMRLINRPVERLAAEELGGALAELLPALAGAREAARSVSPLGRFQWYEGGDSYSYRQFGQAMTGYADQNYGILPSMDKNLHGARDADAAYGIMATPEDLERRAQAPGRPAEAAEPSRPRTATQPSGGYTGPPPLGPAYLPTRRPDQGALLTLRVPLDRTGQVFRFERLDGSGAAGLTYLPATTYRFLTWAAFGAVALVGLALWRAPLRRRLLYVLLVLIASSVLPYLVGRGITGIMNGAFWGGLAVLGWHVLLRVARLLVRLGARLEGKFERTPMVAGVLKVIAVLLVLGIVLSAVASAAGAEMAQPEPRGPAGAGRAPKGTVPFFEEGVEKGDRPLRDAVIIPYDPAHPELARQSDRVYLPYERYLEMWNLAHPERAFRIPLAPPVEALVSSATYTGRLTPDVLAATSAPQESVRLPFEAEFRIHVLKPGWSEVRLGLAGVALREATLDGQPTTLKAADGGGYSLFIQSPMPDAGPSIGGTPDARRPAPDAHVLRVLFVAPASVLGQTGRSSFSIPAAPMSSVEMTVPAADVEMTVADGTLKPVPGAATLRRFVLGQFVRTLDLAWSTRRAAVEREATVAAALMTFAAVEEGLVRSTVAVRYDLAQGERRQFLLALPADLEIEQVTGENVRSWRVVEEAGKPKTLELTLHRPTSTRFDAVIAAHRIEPGGRPAPAVGAYALPLLSTLDAGRESGQVGLALDPALSLDRSAPAGLEQMSAGQFEGPGAASMAWRYARQPAVLQLAVARKTALARADVRTQYYLRQDAMSLRAEADVSVEGVALYTARFALPREIRNAVVTAAGAGLENWFLTDEAERKVLTVNFSPPIQPGTAAQVRIAGDVPKPAAGAALVVAPVTLLDADRQTNAVAVLVGPGLEVSTSAVRGLEPVDARTLANWAAPERGERLVLGFTRSEQRPQAPPPAAGEVALPPAVDLALRPLAPKAVAETVSYLCLTDTFVAHRFVVGYRVENAPVKQFRFALPVSLGESVEVTGERIRQVTSTVEGAGESARRIWTVTLQGEVMGTHLLFVYHEDPAPTGAQLAVPRIDVLEVDRCRNFVAIQNDSRFEVRPRDVKIVERMSVKDLPIWPQGVRPEDILGAWRCINGLWAIDLDLVAYQGSEVQRDAVEIMDIVTVIENTGRARSQITYRLNNRSRQFLELALPEKSTLWSAAVAGRPVKPTLALRAGQPLVLIPLIKTAPEEFNYSAVVVLEGDIEGGFNGWGSSIRPLVPQVVGIPVKKTLLTLYLPPEYEYFDDRGNMERTVAAERAAEWIQATVNEQERLGRLARFGKDQTQLSAWSNYKLNADNLRDQLTWFDETRSMSLRDGTAYERAKTAELEGRVRDLKQKGLARVDAPGKPAAAPTAETSGRAPNALQVNRDNTWTINPNVSTVDEDKALRVLDLDAREMLDREDQGREGDRYARWRGQAQAGQAAAQPGPGRTPTGQVVRLSNAQAQQVAAIVQQLARQGQGARAGTQRELNKREEGEVTVQTDLGNNALILSGDAESVRALEGVVKSLDSTSSTRETSEVRVYALKAADANQVALALKSIFSQRQTAAAAGQRGGEVLREPTIASDPRTNGLIVSGSTDDLRQVQDLVAKLDVPPAAHEDRISGERVQSAYLGLDFEGGVPSTGVPPAAAGEGGLLSLAIDIPRTGVRLDFVKDQGDPELTLSVVDRDLVEKWTAAGVGLGLALVTLLMTNWRRMRRCGGFVRAAAALALLAAGTWAAVTGFYTGLGVVVALLGAALFVWWIIALERRRRTAER